VSRPFACEGRKGDPAVRCDLRRADEAGIRRLPADERRLANALGRIRHTLGDEVFETACADGSALSLDEALALGGSLTGNGES
jgi:hypothetical protein